MSGKVLEIGRRVTFSKNLRKVLRQGQSIPAHAKSGTAVCGTEANIWPPWIAPPQSPTSAVLRECGVHPTRGWLGSCAELTHECSPQLLACREGGAIFWSSARRKLGGANEGRCRAEPSRDIAANRTSIGTTQPTRAGRSGGGASDVTRSFGERPAGGEARGSPLVEQHGFENWRLPKPKRRQKESSSW
jgi:hypothetical protein